MSTKINSPWELSEPGAEGVDVLSRDFPDGRQMRIATVQPWPGFERTARLMAASKEMYEALQTVAEYWANTSLYIATKSGNGSIESIIENALLKAVPR